MQKVPIEINIFHNKSSKKNCELMRIVCESKMLYQTNMHDDISKLDPHIFNWKLNQRWIKSEQKASQLKVKIHHTSCMAHAQNPKKQTRKK